MTNWFDPSAPLDQQIPPSRIYRRIGRFMWDFKGGIAIAIGLAFLASISFVLLPWTIRYLIDGVLLSDELDIPLFGHYETATRSDQLSVAVRLAGAFLALQFLAAIFLSASFYWFARTALFMIHTLRGAMLSHLRHLSLGYHATTSTGDMIFRSINDARSIQEVMIFGVQAWILPIFQVALMIILMLILDPWLTLAAVSVGPVLIFAIKKLTSRIQAASSDSRGHLSRLTSLIEQTMNSIRAVQVFGSESDEGDRFDGTSRNFIKAQLRFRMTEQALSVTTMLLTGLGTAIVLYVASRRVIAGAVTVGALWIFINYMQRIYEVLQQNMSLFGVLQDSVVGVGRAFQVLDTEPDITDAPDAIDVQAITSELRFTDVSLTYDDAPVLSELSFTVQRGEKIAIVGPTGAGKSSLLHLIPRLYDTSSGKVTIDGHDVRDLTLTSLRAQISVVPQEPLLFSTSIRDNIAYGRPSASEEEIIDAARAASAHDFIEAIPDGYESNVGDRGVKLSVGQQQRIAIARAFLKDSPILLLDEPTSALDLSTESDLIASLDELMVGRTVFIVAHRLSTIRSVDRILVVDAGRLVEVGPHSELVTAGGLYQRLWDSQFTKS